MNKVNDLLKILGIDNSSNISLEDVKKAYKHKALQLHPDRGGDEDKFKELNNAYNSLIEKPCTSKITVSLTLYDLIVNRNKNVLIKVKRFKNKSYIEKQISISFNNGFKSVIHLFNVGDEGLFVNGDIIVNLHLNIEKNIYLDHNVQELKNTLELTYLDVYFKEFFSFFYTFIDGTKYKINYKKNNIVKDVFYLPSKCNFIYDNKKYKVSLYINVKKPTITEIDLIKNAVRKYTIPKGIEYGFVDKNNNKINSEIEDIIEKLDYMRIKDLKEICKNNKLQGYSKYTKKNDLILFMRNRLN